MKKKLGWILSLTLCFALMIAVTLVAASASASVSYIDASGDEQTCDSATVVTESDTTWNAGWYVVNDDVTIDQRVTVTGSVHLILADECTLNANWGINVSNGSSLTIYGQSSDENTMGKLTAKARDGFNSAGIGGVSGNITITGGNVTATGSGKNNSGAGAGIGGDGTGDSGTITISGGIVRATGGTSDYGGGAGIGGGGSSKSAQEIVITGGVIIAEGGLNGAAGIGGGGHEGELKSISITGGWIQATGHRKNGQDDDANQGYANAIGGGAGDGGGPADPKNFSNTVIIDGHTQKGTVYGSASLEENAEIPEGYTLTVPSGATLTIPEGVTLTNNGTITVESGGTLTNNGTIVNNGTINGTVGGSGKVVVDTYYLNTDNETTNQQAIPVTTGSTTWGGSAPDGGWYVVQGEVTISSRVTVTGNVHLILKDGCNLTVNGGIDVTGTNSLTIYAQSAGEGMGKLTANAA